MKLVIAEKPSVAQSISKVLKATSRKDGYTEGNGYIVTWCVGHLVSLAPPESYGERYNKWEALPIIPQKWEYDIIPGTKKQFGIIKKLMSDKRIDTIVCATDAGREGELIFRLVYEKCKCKKPVKRLWVSSLEDEAIRKGFENLKSSKCYDDLYRSALCRERADWLIGMNATRYFTVKNGNKGVISIGRVQTPTLALIVSRDREIQNFVKKKYYTVEINCGEFTATSERIDDTNTAEELYRKCKIAKAVVKNITKEDKSISPPKLYDLTALQRDANRIYGFTSQQTLDTVQKLYEDKLVTYPRTDSRYLTEDMLQPASEIINIVVDKLHLNTYTPNIKTVTDNSKVSDHHAIIPTANISDIEIDTLEDKSQKILLLLMKRLVSATSDKYRYKNTVVLLECCGADFKATGKTVTDKGFKAIENTPDEDNNESYPLQLEEDETISDRIVKHFGKQLSLEFTAPVDTKDSEGHDIDDFGTVTGKGTFHYATDFKTEEGDVILAPISGLCKVSEREGRGFEYVISTAYNDSKTDFDFTKNGFLIKISCSGWRYVDLNRFFWVNSGDWLGIVGTNPSVNYYVPDSSNDTENEDIYAYALFPCFTGTTFHTIGKNTFSIPDPEYNYIHMEMYKLPCDFTKKEEIEKNVMAPELFFDYSKETIEFNTEPTTEPTT